MKGLRIMIPLVVAAALAGADLTPVPNRAPLQPNAFNQLPLGSVKPRGWLLHQLRIQADGLTSHLDEFWPDLRDSAWLGGTGEGWERGPYYMDGLVPLAYLLDDPVLVEKARRWVGWMLDHPGPNGWIGPEKNKDWWPNYVALKALTQYQESTGDARVIPLMQRYFAYQLSRLAANPLHEWAVYRWQDEVLSVVWLYNRTGDERLLQLARMLHDQGHDWEAQFANFKYTGKEHFAPGEKANLATHGVNNGMALKTGGLWWLLTGNPADRAAPAHMLEELDRYDGLPSGVFSCDEHYAGRNPSQGTELCTVVEEMFSLESLMSTVGDARFGDREEKIAFNALPATFDAKMWAHQYDQQANQVLATELQRDWVNNGPDSNLFGLEPNYGCCTANMHQGWPKFAANLWMTTADNNGVAAVFYGPSEVRTVLKNGTRVHIIEDTEYPFRDSIRLTVDARGTFPLIFREPRWCAGGAQVSVNGKPAQLVPADGFASLVRAWNPGDRVNIRLPMQVRATRWYNDSVSLERGPLVYSLRIGEDWKKLKTHGPAADWQVTPTTPWNYGLAIDPDNPGSGVKVVEKAIGDFPFSAAGAPVLLQVPGRRVVSWGMEKGSAQPPPEHPQPGTPVQTLTLIPYGAAKLRVTEFPLVPPGVVQAALR